MQAELETNGRSRISPTLAVVIPCFNEKERLQIDAYEAFSRAHPDILLVFVDDGSRDGTALVLKELAVDHPERIFAIELDTNSGKAEAVRTGMLFCAKT